MSNSLEKEHSIYVCPKRRTAFEGNAAAEANLSGLCVSALALYVAFCCVHAARIIDQPKSTPWCRHTFVDTVAEPSVAQMKETTR